MELQSRSRPNSLKGNVIDSALPYRQAPSSHEEGRLTPDVELQPLQDGRENSGVWGLRKRWAWNWRALLIGTAVGVIVGIGIGIQVSIAQAKTAGGRSFNVAVIGDWGRRGAFNQLQTADAMGAAASKHPVDFVISTGDNVYPSGLSGPHDVNDFQGSFSNIYTAASLKVPWHAILGNHDYGDGDHSQSPNSCTLYENSCTNVGELNECCFKPEHELDSRYRTESWGDARWHAYRSFQLQPQGRTDVEFFFMDTVPFVTSYKSTLWYAGSGDSGLNHQSWRMNLMELDNALGASSARWKIVVGHHPVYSYSSHGHTKELIDNLVPVMKKHKVALYVNGHDHCMQVIRKDGITYVTSGAGSKITQGFVNLPTADGSSPSDALLLYDKNGFALFRFEGSNTFYVDVYGIERPEPVYVHTVPRP